MDTATRAVLDALKTGSKKVDHKAAEAKGEYIGNKISDKIVKGKPVIDENSRNIEEIVIPTEKRKKKIEQIKTIFIKWNTIKYLNC